ncbi:MAG: DUF3616 domain-containing protein [Saprospiraceae bacterium]|nr:DUF3616 domain-containing protein [Saprospiraceae bacterium]
MNRIITQHLLVWMMLGFAAAGLQAQIITQWNFNSVPADASTSTGSTAPNVGAGTVSLAGGTTATFASGTANGGSTDPALMDNTGYNITAFAAQSTGDRSRGIQFLLSTVGYNNIQVSWDQRHSNTAPRHVQLQYTADGGITWTDAGALFEGTAGDMWFNGRSVDLSAIPAAGNNANFGIRIVAAFDPASGTSYTASNTSSSYATSGTWRFDMVTISGTPLPAPGMMRITEYMYSGNNDEFIEFTNVGTVPVDMTGWSFDDDSRTPGVFDLSGFGIVAPGESVIITETTPAAFRSNWGLCDNVKVLGPYTNNLGRNDEINLYNAGGNLIDRLTYGDENFPGSIRTQNASGWVTAAGLGANLAAEWTLASIGDTEGSYASSGNDIGSPGRSTRATVTFVACPPPRPDMRITEWMYSGGNGEFVEFTNVGSTSINMTGWSYDDDSRTPGVFDLSGFGTVEPGESVIITEATPADFRASWGLCDNVKVLGPYTNNLGRTDEINLFDAGGFLVDRLTYNDEGTAPVNGPRTQNASAWVTAAALGNNTANQWVLSTLGDVEGSYTSNDDAIGNPGSSAQATVSYDPCVVPAGLPTIALNLAATNDYLDAGLVAPPAAPYAVSGVIADPTDPMSLYGIAFTLADPDTPVENLTFTAATSNPAVAPLANITVTGMGADRNVKIEPAGVGFATVTLTVSDGVLSSTYQVFYAASAASTTAATTRWHTEAADASTAVSVGGGYMFVADDEDETIRLFNRNESGLPIAGFNFTNSLGLTDLDGGIPREVDIEGSFLVGNRIFWIGSHGNGAEGQNRPNRRRLFATDVSGGGASATLTYAGRYDNLRADLIAWGDANGYNFTASAATPMLPTVENGFNIEGFTMAPDGSTALIGFRAPRVPVATRNKALIAPVSNFQAWFNNGAPAGAPAFGAPIELDLGGRAIRSLECNGNGCLIVAGNTDDSGNFKLYTWSGNPADVPQPRNADLSRLTPEGIVELPAGPFLGTAGDNLSVQLISDKGTADYYANGQEAKDLPNNNHKKFRSDPVVLGEVDLPAPQIVLSAQPLNVECDGMGNTAAINAWLASNGGATASVACAPGTWSNQLTASNPGPGNTGCETYLFTITDDCGRSVSTSATVCIQDNTPPSVVCFNQTISFNGQASIALNAGDLVDASDLCSGVSISLSPSVITCDQVGQTVPVLVTVTDGAGNPAQCMANITVGGVPCGWSQNPNGVNCANGNSIAYNPANGVWTATSTNCFYGPGYTSDATAFTQRSLCGDGSITAQVTSISGTTLGWAGIVMRESNAAGAKKAQLMTNLSSLSRREFRSTTNGAANPQQFPSQNRYWLRLVRAGDQFSMYVSPNGAAWYFVGVQNIPMNACIQMGLVATNYQQTSTVVATFANVSYTGSNVPPLAGAEGAASIEQPNGFEAYPNPTSGELNVNLAQYLGRAVRVEVYGLTGQLLRLVEIEEVQTVTEQLDLSALQSGMYLVKVKSDGLPDATQRVVLARG